MDLTPRQADVILLIRNHRHLHGYAPSVREIASALSLSRATIMAHLNRLVKKGLLKRTPGHHRTLEVVEDAQGVKPAPTAKDKRKPDTSALDWLRNTA